MADKEPYSADDLKRWKRKFDSSIDNRAPKMGLQSDQCYILVAEDINTIFLWKGQASSTRSRFIEAARSMQIQEQWGEEGKKFKIVTVDEGEESPEFLSLIGGKTEGGIAKEIKIDGPTAVKAPSIHPLREKDPFGVPEPAEGMNIGGSKNRASQNSGPLYTGQGSFSTMMQEESHVNYEEIMKKLEEFKIPDGFEREIIIIGDNAYSVVEKVQSFLGKKEVTKEISRVDTIPEGIFFAKDYTPRILTEGSKILAVELLKRTSQTKDKALEGDNDVIIYLSSKK